MIRNINLILFAAFFIASPSVAREMTSYDKKKSESVRNYTSFQRELLSTRLKSERLVRKIRNLSDIERWPWEKMKLELERPQEMLNSLQHHRQIREFYKYSTKKFEKDSDFLTETNEYLDNKHADIDKRTIIHSEIAAAIIKCKKEAEKAYNKTKQLLFVRKQIESLYRGKVEEESRFGGLLGVIRSRLESQDLLIEINSKNHSINEIQRAESRGFSRALGKEKIHYDPKELMSALDEIELYLYKTYKKSLREIRNDEITAKSLRRI